MPRSAEMLAASLASDAGREFLGAVIVLGEHGEILAWNEGATQLFGFDASDVVGRSILDTIVPSHLIDEKRACLASAIASGSAEYEAMRRRKDGVLLWVDVSVRAHDADGRRMLLLNERDITRKRYQREAQLLQTRFRGVLDTGPDATVLVDTTGRIALVNLETERLFGYTRDDLLGQFVEILVPGRFHREHPGHRDKYFQRPQTRPMGIGLELWGRRKDGSEFPVEISLSPLTIDDAQLAMAAIRDVTARKQTEEALKAANAELEAFTYSVSHDLRAPIRQIEGFARMLSEHLGDATDPTAAQYLRRIQDGSKQMGRLVDDLLHLAQLGRKDVRLRRVSLDAIVTDVVATLREEAGGRAIEWRIHPLPTVVADPGLLSVALTNLLANAVKYTRRSANAIIEVGHEVQDDAPVIFIRDNGVGFDLKYADKLFGVFQRLHSSDEFEGTGVGLATVHRIIRKHNGRIWATAAPEQGATFYFTLAGIAAEEVASHG